MSARHPLPWRSVGPDIRDANLSLVVVALDAETAAEIVAAVNRMRPITVRQVPRTPFIVDEADTTPSPTDAALAVAKEALAEVAHDWCRSQTG